MFSHTIFGQQLALDKSKLLKPLELTESMEEAKVECFVPTQVRLLMSFPLGT